MCGFDEGYEDYPLLYFVIPKTDYLTQTVCVKTCPTGPGTVDCHTTATYTSTSQCVNTDTEQNQAASMALLGGGATSNFYAYGTVSCKILIISLALIVLVVSRFCLPKVAADAASDYWRSASETVLNSDLLEQWVSDIKTTWPVIAVSMACAFVIG